MNDTMNGMTSVLIAGVGGQGTVLASRVLSLVVMKAGMEVKQSEIHGMSQRGGSVVTHVRFGHKVYSPLVTYGSADFVMAFEELEALRSLPYLRPSGSVIFNTQRMLPMPVITGAAVYPVDVAGEMRALGLKVNPVDASGIGQEKGDARTANMVLMGVLSRALPSIPDELWYEAMAECLRENLVAMNREAFQAGQMAYVI